MEYVRKRRMVIFIIIVLLVFCLILTFLAKNNKPEGLYRTVDGLNYYSYGFNSSFGYKEGQLYMLDNEDTSQDDEKKCSLYKFDIVNGKSTLTLVKSRKLDGPCYWHNDCIAIGCDSCDSNELYYSVENLEYKYSCVETDRYDSFDSDYYDKIRKSECSNNEIKSFENNICKTENSKNNAWRNYCNEKEYINTCHKYERQENDYETILTTKDKKYIRHNERLYVFDIN